MHAHSRNAEKHAFPFILDQITKQFKVNDITNFEEGDEILEGTGAIIIDRILGRVYCSKSHRAEEKIFNKYAK